MKAKALSGRKAPAHAPEAPTTPDTPDWREQAVSTRCKLLTLIENTWKAGSVRFECDDENMLLHFAQKHLSGCDLLAAHFEQEDWDDVLVGLRSAVLGAIALSGNRQSAQWRAALEDVLSCAIAELGEAAEFPEHAEPPPPPPAISSDPAQVMSRHLNHLHAMLSLCSGKGHEPFHGLDVSDQAEYHVAMLDKVDLVREVLNGLIHRSAAT